MKKLIVSILVLIFSISTALAATHKCEFEHEDKEGTINIDISGETAKLDLNYDGNKSSYKKCNVSNDQFGTLVDCSELDFDLMVIINKDDVNNGVGIMTESLGVYSNGDCS